MIRRSIRCGLAMLLAISIAHARQSPDTPPEADKPATPAEQYQALEQEFVKARADFSAAYRAAETPEERQKVLDEQYPRPEKFVGRFFKLAQDHADDPVAVDALVWIVTNGQGGETIDKAMEILASDHIESEKLGSVCQRLMYSRGESTEKLLRNVMEKSPHHDAQGHACFALANVLLRSQSEDATAEAELLLERVVEKYADVATFRGTLADAAKNDLFELRFLGIGKVAPEIEGEDIDGVEFKLSDYRGKVVVLDFWGHW